MLTQVMRRWHCWIYFGVLLLPTSPLWGAELKQELTLLLDQGWQSSVKNYQDSERAYVRLAEQYPTEVRVPYAMAIVAIKHRRYSTALERIDEMLALRPNLWIGQRTRLWLLVVLRQNEAALEQSALLCEQLMEEKQLSETERDARARWLGRLFAYIAAPTGSEVAETMIQRYEKRILAAFDPATTIVFDEGRDAFLTDFSERQFKKQQIKAEEKIADEKKKVEREEELKTEKVQTEQAAVDIEAQAKTLREQLEPVLNELDSAIGEKQTALSSVQQQASIILTTMDQLAVNINTVRLQLDATPPEDVFEQNRLLAILRAWDLDYARQAAIYRPLAVQGQALQNDLATLNGQRQQAVAQFDAQMNTLGKTLTNLQRRALRIQSDERKLSKTNPTGNTARVQAKTLVLTAFTTYEPFPVEQEKQTILRSLK